MVRSRTQGAPTAELSARPRTPRRAAQRGLAAQGFIAKGARMRYGLCVANIGTYADPRTAARLAAAAEAAGWEAFFVWDHLGFVWDGDTGDPWMVLTAAAAATSTLVVGTAVTPVPRRRLQVLASQVATLDLMSGGRTIFGAGTGGVKREFSAFGEPDDARLRAAMLDEGLDVLNRLWSGEDVTHRGMHYP